MVKKEETVKEKKEVESISHYGFDVLVRENKLLRQEVESLKGVQEQIVAFLDSLQKVETEQEPVQEFPTVAPNPNQAIPVPKKKGWLDALIPR